jgi:hypothetical protein
MTTGAVSWPVPEELAGATVRLEDQRWVWEPGTPFVDVEHHEHGSTLRVKDVARFDITADEVVVRPVADVHPDVVTTWLYATATALLLAHRGQFALHATTVERAGWGLALSGDSGAGKSTTSLALVQRDWRLVADDVSVVATDGAPAVLPFGRPVHLWPETAARLGLDLQGSAPLHPRTPKLRLPAPPSVAGPLSCVLILSVAEVPQPLSRLLRGGEAVAAVAANAYRSPLLARRWPGQLLTWASSLAAGAPVHLLERPREPWSVDEVVRIAEDLVAER